MCGTYQMCVCREHRTHTSGTTECSCKPRFIDETVIPIQNPPARYHPVLRKGFHITNDLVVCDAEEKFMAIDVRIPGCTRDARVRCETNLKATKLWNS